MCSCHCSKLTKVSVQWTMMVIIAERIHLFPFRTQQLSSHTSTIFGWRRPEKIDRCHQPDKNSFDTGSFFMLSPAKWKKGSHKANALKGKGITEQKMKFAKYEQMIKSECYDEETARENRSLPSTWCEQIACLNQKSHRNVWLFSFISVCSQSIKG